jgi:hypothetical protein
MAARLSCIASMPKRQVVMTMNTIAPKVSGIQPVATENLVRGGGVL